MLDISLGGALLAAEAAAAGRARRRSCGRVLVRVRFTPTCRCRRTVGLPAGVTLNGLGAMFTTMDERSRRSLEDFLRKASQ